MKQATALDILKTGQNVFLTGSAGSGKTYTLNQYIHYLRARRIAVATTASTGIAATHMNGITIHSWASIGIKDELTEKDLSNIARKNIVKERIKETSVLIIDEVSMLHAKQLNMVNEVTKHIRNSAKPFGGIQVVVAGDFFQLPPVGNRGEINKDKFCFMSQAWLDADFKICYLTEQHRQQTSDSTTDNTDNAAVDLTLDDILNQIRAQQVNQQAIDALKNTYHQDVDANRTRLFTHNVNVNTINERELALLDSKGETYNAIAHGDNKLVDTLKKTVRTSPELVLKKGAKVMFIKNNNDLGVSNGTMGELIGFKTIKSDKTSTNDKNDENSNKSRTTNKNSSQQQASIDDDDIENVSDAIAYLTAAKNIKTETIENSENQPTDIDAGEAIEDAVNKTTGTEQKYPVVKLNSGRQVIAAPEEWMIEDEHGEVLASYSQIPLTLAWAITIHKSQGMTLDAAEIDLSKTFELGQGYVALSRLKSLEGLKLLGMNDLSLQLDPLARKADARFQELSQEVQADIEAEDKQALIDKQDRFVLISGGTLSKKAIDSYEKQLKNSQRKQADKLAQKNKLSNQTNDKSQSTIIATKLLLEESLSIAEIAQTRGLAQSTIMRHIGEIMRQYPELKCDHLRPEDAILKQVSKAVDAIVAAGDPNDFLDSNNDNADEHSDKAIFDKSRIKLRPIHEYLKNDVDYNTIRLALMFID